MKRASIFAFPLILALLLTGCGGKQTQTGGTVTPAQTPATAPTSSVETAAPTENPVSLGRIEGGTYTNTYGGFGCTLDANWEFYSAEELQELPSNVQELFEDTELADAVSGADQIMDMKAENVNDLTTMNVLYNKLDAQSRLAYAMLSEKDIVDALMEQKDLMISSYSQAGIEVSSMEEAEVEFLGEKHLAVRTVSTWDGVPYFTLQLFDYHAGRYSITLTFASYLEDKTDDLLTLFYKVD